MKFSWTDSDDELATDNRSSSITPLHTSLVSSGGRLAGVWVKAGGGGPRGVFTSLGISGGTERSLGTLELTPGGFRAEGVIGIGVSDLALGGKHGLCWAGLGRLLLAAILKCFAEEGVLLRGGMVLAAVEQEAGPVSRVIAL